MKPNPANWFEIYVQDMERAKDFYKAVLSTSFSRINSPSIEMWGFPSTIEAPGASGSLVKMPGFPSGGNSTLVYFRCEDCATEGSRVVPAGGRIQRDKTAIGEYGFIVLAYDTEGNMFGLHSLK